MMPGERPQRGQAMVLFALMLPVLLGAIALVIDLGNGYVARRDLQNSADLGSLAVVQYLGSHSAPSDQQVTKIVNDLVSANAPLSGAVWSAVYLDRNGSSTGINVNNAGHTVPPGALGVMITPTVRSQNFFEQVLGSSFISVAARGGAVGAMNAPGGGSPAGGTSAPAIVALDAGSHIYPHSIISDANGTFDVTSASGSGSGSIIDNACYGTWDANGTYCSDYGNYTDTVDAKDGGMMNIAGQFITASPSPFDSHFSGHVGGKVAYGKYGNGTTVIKYGSLKTAQPYYADPLANIPEPVSASAACGGGTALTYVQSSFANGPWTPGIYQGNNSDPAVFTGNTTLNDCGGSVSGVYIFPNGVIFQGAVTANDVLLYSQGQIDPTHVCTDSTQPNNGGALLSEPFVGSSSGVNVYGFIFTGTQSVTLSAPNSGLYMNLALFQSRNVPGHIGFKVCPGDSGNISLTGTVYAHNINDVPNNSANTLDVTNYNPDTCHIPYGWCNAGNASALVFGTDDGYMEGNGTPPPCATGDSPTCTWPTYGGGNLTIDGAAVVDVFYTTGNANVNIKYDKNHVPLMGARLVPR